MLAFRMKAPQEELQLERALSDKVDSGKWGMSGKDLIAQLDGMRKRMAIASKSYGEKGKEECREVHGRYQALVHKVAIVCEGISLKDLKMSFKWSDAFDLKGNASVPNWSFERAAALFNLAASIGYIATFEDRGTPEGINKACTLYQQAAGTSRERSRRVVLCVCA